MIALRGLGPGLRPWAEYAVKWAEYVGIPVRVTSVVRTWAEQATLYRRYRTAVGSGRFPSASVPYPANRPGDSAHQYRLAWDSVVSPEFQNDWNEIRRQIGWTVPSNDLIHAEYPGWRNYVRR